MTEEGTWDTVLAIQTPCGGCRRPDRLVSLGGLHDRPRTSAREEHHPAHRRLDRTTRNPREEPADHGIGRSRGGAEQKAYSSRAIGTHLCARGIKAVIPEPAEQQGHRRRRGSAGGRPVGLGSEAYTGRDVIKCQYAHLKQWPGRDVIKCQYAHLKQWPGLASRYDKYAIVYRAAVVLNAALARSKASSDTP